MDVDSVDNYLKMPKDVFIYFVLEGKLKGKDLVGLCLSNSKLNRKCNESGIFDILLEKDFGMKEYKGMKGRELYVFLHSNIFRVYMKEGLPHTTKITYEVKFADREKPFEAGKGMSVLIQNLFEDNNVPEIVIDFDEKFKSFFIDSYRARNTNVIYYCCTSDLKVNTLIHMSINSDGEKESFDVSNNDFELKYGEERALEFYEEISNATNSVAGKKDYAFFYFAYPDSDLVIYCQKIVIKGL